MDILNVRGDVVVIFKEDWVLIIVSYKEVL